MHGLLFCTARGPNLRNEAAHGLLSSEDGHSVGTVYAWWWVLRLLTEDLLQSRLAVDHSLEIQLNMATPEPDESGCR